VKNNRGFKRIILWLTVLSMLWGGCWNALADALFQEERTPAEMELDGIAFVFETYQQSVFYQSDWSQEEWYPEWQRKHGLSGSYGFGWLQSDPGVIMNESEAADVALEYWKEQCGITPFNDFSHASEIYPVHCRDEKGMRNMLLVTRIHDEPMPDYYVLVAGENNAVLAGSSVTQYKRSHEAMIAVVEAERAEEDRISQLAVEAVIGKYGAQLSWLTDEYFQNGNISVHPVANDEWGHEIRAVEIDPPDGFYYEFYVVLDAGGKNVYDVKWYPQEYHRYTEEQKQDALAAIYILENAYQALLDQYGEGYRIPFDKKMEFYQQCDMLLSQNNRWDFLFLSPLLISSRFVNERLAVPAEEDITEEAAKNILIRELTMRYVFTQAQAQSLAYYGQLICGTNPEQHIWQFWMDIGRDTLLTASLDGKTGEILSFGRGNGLRTWEKTNLDNALQARYGEWGVWPIEIKARFGAHYMQAEHDYGVPAANQIQADEALELAKAALLSAYPELTREQLDAARICPYFTVKPHMLYGVVYEPSIYYFAFDVDAPYNCYEVILDGDTGEIYLTHDPSNSGNG